MFRVCLNSVVLTCVLALGISGGASGQDPDDGFQPVSPVSDELFQGCEPVILNSVNAEKPLTLRLVCSGESHAIYYDGGQVFMTSLREVEARDGFIIYEELNLTRRKWAISVSPEFSRNNGRGPNYHAVSVQRTRTTPLDRGWQLLGWTREFRGQK